MKQKDQVKFEFLFNKISKGPIQFSNNGVLTKSHISEKADAWEPKGKIQLSAVQSIWNEYVPSNSTNGTQAKSLNNSPKRRPENPGRGRNLTIMEAPGFIIFLLALTLSLACQN